MNTSSVPPGFDSIFGTLNDLTRPEQCYLAKGQKDPLECKFITQGVKHLVRYCQTHGVIAKNI